MKRLNLLNDYLFLKMMGEAGDEAQLLSFLNAVLKRTKRDELKTVEIVENTEFTADNLGNKSCILDVRSKTSDGTRLNIEVQLVNQFNMNKRSLYYWSREFIRGISAGDDYKNLADVIAINIVDFDYIPLDDFHTSFHIYEDRNKNYRLTDSLEIHFLDMVKFRGLKNKDIRDDSLHRWLTFFDKNVPENVLKEVIKMEPAINKAFDKIEEVMQDKEALRRYEMRAMALSDETSRANWAREQREQGLREGKYEVARNALMEGVDIKFVSKITGFSIDELSKIEETMTPPDIP